MTAEAVEPEWDVFIAHASEDKDAVVRPLAAELRGRGLRVWYDEYELKIGDSLRASIERGLAGSKRGVVIISPSFFSKSSAQEELSGFSALEAASASSRVLPVWHNVGQAEVAQHSPMLADRFAGTTAESIPKLAVRLIEALNDDGSLQARPPVVALTAEVTNSTESSVSLRLSNIGSVHATNVSLEPRGVEGPGVPLTSAGSEAILAGASEVFLLGRLPGANCEAEAQYDLLYTDPAERVVKRQGLRFVMDPDVVTGREFVNLTLEHDGAEETLSREALEPWPDHAENLVQAWLFRQDWLLTGSTVYIRALRQLHGPPLNP